MSEFFHALEVFYDHLAAVHWGALGIALVFHFLKALVRTFAWRNILRAAFPEARVRRRTVLGAYLAGVGVNSLVPVRGGDAVKLLLAHRGIKGSNYATLSSTLVVETMFDFVAAGALFIWAFQMGVLPSLDVLPRLPDVDWTWALRHPRLGIGFATALVVALVVGGAWAAQTVTEFRRRLERGFAILGNPRLYVTQVVSWQALSWGFRLVSVWWFLRAFGVPATVHNALLVVVVQSLSTLLPFSPGGAGTQQGLTVYVLRGRASRISLLSFSVGMYITTTAANLLLGFGALLLTLRTVRWRRFVAAHHSAPAGSEVRRKL